MPSAPRTTSNGTSADVREDGTKTSLRARLLAARAGRITGTDHPVVVGATETDGAATTARRILDLPEVASARWVAAYASLPGEPETGRLLRRLRGRGIRVLLPSMRPDLDLDFREYTGALIAGAFGTREPPLGAAIFELAQADVIVVPALAVDVHGRRLGRGGGSYDRALRRARPDALIVAVVHDNELVDRVPTEAHDVAVHVIVTPRVTLRCGTSDGAQDSYSR
ncbi:5-formyltetrahydrofolate cyclo-ligase [Candidatus Protofrankia datiscae]|uniref:5-formyltetrahydrofolate cyclo-ligase n=1 Tax=Candidatus Protofrankia datiscae TaxID=2716812 RepID=F8AW52_9ACTN|nr:5-formyltetrahydrofolate cyclo-ligase [Candidatus Protofrankia datiscae]